MKLSTIIIAKNAEDQIADAIASVDFSDEVVLVDGGSEDRTAEIAEKMKAKVFVKKTDDFSEMRNFGLSKAKGTWILYVDSDERVSVELKDTIEREVLSNKKNEASAYKINRKNFYLGNHEWPHKEKLERLFKKETLEGWYGKLHESPRVKGTIGELSGLLLHYTHKDLSSMMQKTIEWSKIEAELRYNAGHPPMKLWRFIRVMITAFIDSYIKQSGWKVGTVGLIESIYQSFSMFVTYARLWELQKGKK